MKIWVPWVVWGVGVDIRKVNNIDSPYTFCVGLLYSKEYAKEKKSMGWICAPLCA